MYTNLTHTTHTKSMTTTIIEFGHKPPLPSQTVLVGQRSRDRESDGEMERGGGDKDLGLVA